MTPYEVVDLTLSIAGRLEMQWGLFISVHLALFAGIIYVDRPLRVPEKWGATILYSGFAAVNYLLLKKQLELLEGAFREATRLLTMTCCSDNQILVHMTHELSVGHLSLANGMLLLIHALAFVLVLLSIAFDRARNEPGSLAQKILQ